MIGQINGGVSGITLGHSDIGGYTSAFAKPLYEYYRDQDLLFRWIEMSTFSDVIMRSHPSNIPLKQAQIYDSIENINFFKKFVDIHVGLSDYKQSLMKETQEKGKPFTRPLLLHFPKDETARKNKSQFMLGDCIMMAPIF
jgi:alpha-glucosidase